MNGQCSHISDGTFADESFIRGTETNFSQHRVLDVLFLEVFLLGCGFSRVDSPLADAFFGCEKSLTFRDVFSDSRFQRFTKTVHHKGSP